jgi:prevent-host-death family protein
VGRRSGAADLVQHESDRSDRAGDTVEGTVIHGARCATMSHMERVGVRELRRSASAILRRVAAGETVEVTDRGRPVAVLLRTMPSGLARLEREGLLRRGEADLLDLQPVRLPPNGTAPSQLVSEARAD